MKLPKKINSELAALEIERRKRENPIQYYNTGALVHKKQMDFHQSKKRKRALFGGNRTGKTVAGAIEAIWRARGNHPFAEIKKPTKGWVVSLTNEVQRDVAQAEILRWLPKRWIKDIVVRQGRKDDPTTAIIDFIVVESLHGGESIIGFKTCEQGREKFQGTSQDWIWFDEEPPKSIYDECLMRLIDTQGCLWMTMTPLKGLTFVYDLLYLNEIQDPEVAHWCMEWADNPYLSRAEIAALESTLTEDEREARQYGRFVALSGLVYKEFREDIHVIEPFKVPEQWYDNISIDPGYNNPTSVHFYACDGDGNVYVIAEHYEAEQPIDYHAERIKEIAESLNWPRTQSGKRRALIDSAANQKTTASQKSTADIYRECSIACNTEVDKDVWSGIQRVKQYMKLREHPDKEAWPRGKPMIFIFKTCVNMIRELKSYRWAEPKEGVNAEEKPRKAHDHAMDELRYYIMSKPEPYKEVKKNLNYKKGCEYFRNELKMKGFSDFQINQLAKKGEIKIIGN